MLRALLLLSAALLIMPLSAGTAVAATACVRIAGGNFDAPGNDNYHAYINGEYIRIKNFCASSISIARWRLHDYNSLHTYTFPATFRLSPGATVTVYSGQGRNSSTKLYWGRYGGAIWNNDPPERAYLLNASGRVQSTWSEYD